LFYFRSREAVSLAPEDEVCRGLKRRGRERESPFEKKTS